MWGNNIKRTLAAAGVALFGAAFATSASADLSLDDLIEGLTVVNFDLTANIDAPSINLDLNGDDETDFIIDIQFGNDIFDSGLETGLAITEFATIRAADDTNNLEAGIFVADFRIDLDVPRDEDEVMATFLPFPTPDAAVFEEGNLIGGGDSEPFVPFFEALLYAEGEFVDFTSNEAATDDVVDGPEFITGPFGEVGSTGFIGLFVTDQTETTNFGFAEITRGSVNVGNVGVQTIPGAPAPIPLSAVPVPPAFGLLAGALALFGFMSRRRKAVSA